MLSRNMGFVPAAWAFLVTASITVFASILATINDLLPGGLPEDSLDLIYGICFNYCSPFFAGYELWWMEAIGLLALVSLMVIVFIAVRGSRVRTSTLSATIAALALANIVWGVLYTMLLNQTFGTPRGIFSLNDIAFPAVNLIDAGDNPDLTFAYAFGAALTTALSLITIYLFIFSVILWGLIANGMRSEPEPSPLNDFEWEQTEEWDEEEESEWEEEDDDTDGVPAGWYTDPDGKPCQRYWDGDDWTKKTRPTVNEPQTIATKTRRTTQTSAPRYTVDELPRKARNSLIFSIISFLAGPLPFLWVLPIIAVIYAIRVLRSLRAFPQLSRTVTYWSLGVAIAGIPWMVIIGLSRAFNS